MQINRISASFILIFILASIAMAQTTDLKKNLLLLRDGEGGVRPVTDWNDWNTRRKGILDSIQTVMGKLPAGSGKLKPDIQIIREDHIKGIRRVRITYSADSNDHVPAFIFIPENTGEPVPAILCLHQTISIGKDEPSGEGGSPDLWYALELAERGYVTMAPDYPGYGEYKCDPYAMGYISASMKGIRNHMAAVALLQSMPEVDSNRIGCIGHSLGGHNALFLAVFDKRIKAVVTSCGFTSFFKYFGGDLTGWSHKGYMPLVAEKYKRDPAKMPFDFTEILGAIAPGALFISAPLHDDNFEISGVYDCVREAEKVYTLMGREDHLILITPDAGHSFPGGARGAAYQFFDKELDFKSKDLNLKNDKQ